MPTRAFPGGRTGNVATLREALKAGNANLRNRRVRLGELVAEGDRAAMSDTWEATVGGDAFGFLGLGAGDTMQLEVANFIEVADGLIVRSVEYVLLASVEG